MTEKPKLLWHSNSPWSPTGYGQQTGLFAPRLNEHYDLRVSSFYGLEGAPLIWDGVKVLPGLGGTYGNEALPYHVTSFLGGNRGGLVVSLMDVWVLDARMCSQYDMACWVPVDHDPAPPKVRLFFQQSEAVPLAMSRFAEEKLQDYDPIYVPHGIDTSVYRPIEDVRSRFGIPEDRFIVGMVAANKGNTPSRKSFVAALQAFAEFHRKHPEALLYLHTDIDGQFGLGVPLEPVIEALGIPQDALRVTAQYAIHFEPTPPSVMAALYSAMDVLLAPSMGEGFGIPIVEAQACGTPVITTDFSAMQEVTGPGSFRVGGSQFWTGQQSWQVLPEIADIIEALTRCHGQSKATRAEIAKQARGHALQYDLETVLADHMLPALEQVRERFEDRKPVTLKAVA
jgi:glycosyltransferase involved in cell wall biosynthesis